MKFNLNFVNLQFFLEILVSQKFFLELLCMKGVGLVDTFCEFSLGLVIEFLDLVNLFCVENIFVANFLEEPEQDQITILVQLT